MDERINLKLFMHIIRKRILTIIITVLIVFLLTLAISGFYLKPTYEATENILIGKLEKNESNYGGAQELSMLLASTIDFIKSPVVLNSVQNELNILDDELAEKVVIQNNRNSQIINIVVRDRNMENSKELAHTIATVSVNKMQELFGVSDIKLLRDTNGEPSVKKVGSMTINIAIGIMVGFLFGIGLSMLREYWDDSIKDTREVEDILGISVLGEVNLKNKRNKSKNKTYTKPQAEILRRNGEQIGV
ncbi:Wzz/FepE/Etk N-terminal domain-containing protein [Neobacillus niacini]|uniref:YveK family protein n=1 Tax=Neobacillus niacini TaxID=86668 RepID=UPI0007AC0FF2|nr:Wzz/FepE/Etk N-terminal domain-containing protein [Neobacillus niacini]MEC1526151.1 Wzz/FepE/Etk N-terminal domain-containing protein [Neobacillus niacini]